MNCTEILKARVSPDLKLQAKGIADRELLTEAAWLKRIVMREIRAGDGGGVICQDPRRANSERQLAMVARGSNGCGKPVYVRLRDEDRLLLEARLTGRVGVDCVNL